MKRHGIKNEQKTKRKEKIIHLKLIRKNKSTMKKSIRGNTYIDNITCLQIYSMNNMRRLFSQ